MKKPRTTTQPVSTGIDIIVERSFEEED